jgi:hypothetical protein
MLDANLPEQRDVFLGPKDSERQRRSIIQSKVGARNERLPWDQKPARARTLKGFNPIDAMQPLQGSLSRMERFKPAVD